MPRKPKTRSQRKARREKMANAVFKGATTKKVADRFDVSLTQVKKACREFGIAFEDRRFNANK